jgi:hypothetical protein
MTYVETKVREADKWVDTIIISNRLSVYIQYIVEPPGVKYDM